MENDEIEWISTTDDQDKAAARAAFDAAFGEIPDDINTTGDWLRASLLAFSAADEALDIFNESLNESMPSGTKTYGAHVNLWHVVASSLYAAVHDLDTDDMSPTSVVTAWAPGLIQACIALNSASELECVTDEQMGPIEGASHSKMVLKLIEENRRANDERKTKWQDANPPK